MLQKEIWLGMAQMAGAAFALALLMFSGISVATITAVAVTTILSLTSFAIRHHKPPMGL